MSRLTGPEIAAAGLDGWAYLYDRLQTRIVTGDFATGLRLVAAVGAAAASDRTGIDLRPGHVDVRLGGYDAGGVVAGDLELARTVSGLAAAAGLRTALSDVVRLEFGLDSPEPGGSAPFWVAVLGGVMSDEEVRDPAGILPAVWFQRSGSAEPRQRWHPDVWVDPSQVRPRLDAALAAGGTLVSDASAPSFWVLADPEGNRVCLCTWQ